jgi:peptide/nickel transport system permease protein
MYWPPSSEWGALLAAGGQYITRAPWLTVLPGAVIVVLALATTSAGRLIRDRLERGDA